MLINRSEILAYEVLSELLPEGSKVVPIEVQSNGEHDFDVLSKDGQRIAVVEVTAAMYPDSKLSLVRQGRRGVIRSKMLKSGWLLMAHNPDPRWIEVDGARLLSVLERHGYTEFDYNTKYDTQNIEVAEAAESLGKMGVENGCSGAFEPGTISLLCSRGEDSDSYILSHEHVTDLVMEALGRPDNARKLSLERTPQGERHLFVEIDEATYPAAGDSMGKVSPPSNPPGLDEKATHIWAAIRKNERVIVWRGDGTGWREWSLTR